MLELTLSVTSDYDEFKRIIVIHAEVPVLPRLVLYLVNYKDLVVVIVFMPVFVLLALEGGRKLETPADSSKDSHPKRLDTKRCDERFYTFYRRILK